MHRPVAIHDDAERTTERLASFTTRCRVLLTGSRRPAGPVVHHGEAWQERHWGSRVLHRVDEATSHAAAGLVAGAAVVLWTAVGLVTRFPSWWQVVLYSSSSCVTLLMVFVIQHSSTRQQLSMQRKLDELLRALPGADDRVIAVEEAPDDELEELAGQSIERREKAGQRLER
jgi:low affinity Fe/Cu permease